MSIKFSIQNLRNKSINAVREQVKKRMDLHEAVVPKVYQHYLNTEGIVSCLYRSCGQPEGLSPIIYNRADLRIKVDAHEVRFRCEQCGTGHRLYMDEGAEKLVIREWPTKAK